MIDIQIDTKKLERSLSKLERKQIPFAVSGAINKTLFGLKQEQAKQVARELDRPIPFTTKGFLFQKAGKRNLVGYLYIPENRYKYMKYQIKGGTRLPNSRSIPIGTSNLKRNKYGNLPRKKITTLLSKPDTFSGEINGVAGIWQRPKRGRQRGGKVGRQGNGGLKLLIAWESSATYTKRFDYYGIGKRYINRVLVGNVEASLQHAIKTAL